MANTTYNFAKAVSLTDYFENFVTGKDLYTWAWDKLVTKKKMNRMTEQVFSWYGMPTPIQVGQFEPVTYYDMGELAATTFTAAKYGIASSFSYELLKYDWQIKDLMGKAGKSMGQGHAYLRDRLVAEQFNDITTNTAFDSTAICGTHTMTGGQSVDNDLTAASLDFDTLWSSINYFNTAMYNHSGQRITSKPKYVLTNPVNQKILEKILNASGEPDTSDLNNPNTIKSLYELQAVYCPHLSSTTQYVVMSEDFPGDFYFMEVDAPKFEEESDFDRHGLKIKSWQIFALGIKDFIHVVNNAGA